jgi:hypothetical protein
MTLIISEYIAERLLAQFSKIIYCCFCIENSMVAVLVSLECTKFFIYFPVLFFAEMSVP